MWERVCVCLLYVLYVQTVYIYIVQRGREATMTVTRSTRVGLTPVMVAVVVMALMLGIDVGKSATVPSKCEGVKLPALHWPCSSSSSFSGNSVHTAEFSSELFSAWCRPECTFQQQQQQYQQSILPPPSSSNCRLNIKHHPKVVVSWSCYFFQEAASVWQTESQSLCGAIITAHLSPRWGPLAK